MEFGVLACKLSKAILLAHRGYACVDRFSVAGKCVVVNSIESLGLRVVFAILQTVVADDVNGIMVHLVENTHALARAYHQQLVAHLTQTVENCFILLIQRGLVLGQRTVQVKSDQFNHDVYSFLHRIFIVYIIYESGGIVNDRPLFFIVRHLW